MSEGPDSLSTASLRRQHVLVEGIVTTVINRVVAALAPLLVIPVALDQLGVEGYGAWATAVSVTALVAFADLGVGTGLMTRLGALVHDGAIDDRRAAQGLVSSAYALVGAVAGTLLVALALVGWLADLATMLNPSATARGDVRQIVGLTLGIFVISMVTSLVVRVQYAVGRQGRANLWQAASSVAMIGSLLLVATTSPPPWLFVLVAGGIPVLGMIVNSAWYFYRDPLGRQIRPTFGLLSTETIASLLRVGVRFLVVSIMLTASIALDPLIVTHLAGLREVPNYVIPFRIFTLIGTVGVMVSLPLWPLHSNAVAVGDVAWIQGITIRMTLWVSLAVGLGVVAALLIGPWFVEAWIGDSIEVNWVLWSGLAGWCIAQTATGPAFMLQNAAEYLGPQLLGYAAFVSMSLPLKLFIGSVESYNWLPWLGTALYCALIWPAAYLGYKRALAIATNSVERAPYG